MLTPFVLVKTVFKHAEPCLKRNMLSKASNSDYGLYLKGAVRLGETAD